MLILLGNTAAHMHVAARTSGRNALPPRGARTPHETANKHSTRSMVVAHGRADKVRPKSAIATALFRRSRNFRGTVAYSMYDEVLKNVAFMLYVSPGPEPVA